MREIGITEFKASCPAVLERVRKTGQPIVVTRFGRPVAKIFPPPAQVARKDDWLGCMKGTAEIKGDLVAPVFDLSEWDAASR